MEQYKDWVPEEEATDPYINFRPETNEDLTRDVEEKIADNDGTVTSEEFRGYKQAQEEKSFFDKLGDFGTGLYEGAVGLGTDIALAGVAGLDAVGIETPATAAVRTPGENFDRQTTGSEVAASAKDGAVKWFARLGNTGANIMDGVTASAVKKFQGLEGEALLEFERRKLNDKLSRNRQMSPDDGQTYLGAAVTAGLSAAGADPETAVSAGREADEQVVEPLSEAFSFAPDFLLSGGVGAAVAKSTGVVPSAVSRGLSKSLGGAGVRVAQKVDDAARTVYQGTGKALAKKGSINTRGAKFLRSLRPAGVIGASIQQSPELFLASAILPSVATAGLKMSTGALRIAHKFGGDAAASASRALKGKWEYGMAGPGQAGMMARMAADTAAPAWVRRTAGIFEQIHKTKGAQIARAATAGAVSEGLQEGLEEALQAEATIKDVARGIGGGAVFGGGVGGIAGASVSLDDHLADLDAVHFRNRAIERGDDVASFDALPEDVRRGVAAVQGALIDTAEVRLVTDSDLRSETKLEVLAEGAYLANNNEILINTDVVTPESVLSVLSHEAGHVAYKVLPEDLKNQWRDIAHRNYGEDAVEQFRKDYSAAVGSEITTDVALDEMFAEQFLGSVGTGKSLLKEKRELSGISLGERRALRRVKSGVLKVLGFEPQAKGQFDFTPYSNSKEVDSFVRSSLKDLGSRLEPAPLPKAKKNVNNKELKAARDEAQRALDETYGVVDLPNGKQVIPVASTERGFSVLDADELSQAMSEVESDGLSDRAKTAYAVTRAKGVERSSNFEPDDAFVQATDKIISEILQDAETSQIIGAKGPRLRPPGIRHPGDIESSVRRSIREESGPTSDITASPRDVLRKIQNSGQGIDPGIAQRAIQARSSGQGGAEHSVHYDPAYDSVVKVWDPSKGFNGLDTPLDYLARLDTLNRVFNTQVAVEGVHDGAIVTSQPFFDAALPEAPHPTPEEIDVYMGDKGFFPSGEKSYSNGRFEVSDAKPLNFIRTPEGVQMVDAVIDEVAPVPRFSPVVDNDADSTNLEQNETVQQSPTTGEPARVSPENPTAQGGLPERGRGGVGRNPGWIPPTGSPYSPASEPPLEGLAARVRVDGTRIEFGPLEIARQAAKDYMAGAGLSYSPPKTYQKVDPERATRIAEAFEAMAHDPQDPAVAASYEAMIQETLAQYEAIKATGLVIEPFVDGVDTYGNPRNAILDVVQNNHLWFFPTDVGFGGPASAEVDISGNPLLRLTGEVINGYPMRANDVFRVVHDYFGHIKEGVGFRADGEENAWRSHAAMYSDLARGAMTTETRGQNSWVNYGPYGEQNRTASGAETEFAPQKIGLLPDWVATEAAGDPDAEGRFSPAGSRTEFQTPPEGARVRYQGVFLGDQRQSLLDQLAERGITPQFENVVAHHMTTEFGEEAIANPRTDLGQDVPLRIIGIARGEGIEALVVDSDRPTGRDITRPHITFSHDNNTKAFESNALVADESNIEYFGSPVTVTGRSGIEVSEDVRLSAAGSREISKPDPAQDSLRLPTALTDKGEKDVDDVPEELLRKQLAKVQQYDSAPEAFKRARNPKKKLAILQEFLADNLVALHDKFDPELRARATQWYDGARNIAEDMATTFDVTPEQAGAVLAALSPQKDWFMNVAQARQVLDIWRNDRDTPLEGPDIEATFAANLTNLKGKSSKIKAARRDREKLFEAIRGKSPEDLANDPTLQAWAIRMLAESRGRDYSIISPEGATMGVQVKGDGTPSKNTWGSSQEIVKAIKAIENPDLISTEVLGKKHKVRNFRNNIVAPNNTLGDVTIDTHAVAAALLLPLGASAIEVGHNFGSGMNSSKVFGVDGSYHIYKGAYTQAAERLGLMPRQLQSITWEAVRGLFSPAERRDDTFIQELRDLWRNNPEAAKAEVLERDIVRPFWADDVRLSPSLGIDSDSMTSLRKIAAGGEVAAPSGFLSDTVEPDVDPSGNEDAIQEARDEAADDDEFVESLLGEIDPDPDGSVYERVVSSFVGPLETDLDRIISDGLRDETPPNDIYAELEERFSDMTTDIWDPEEASPYVDRGALQDVVAETSEFREAVSDAEGDALAFERERIQEQIQRGYFDDSLTLPESAEDLHPASDAILAGLTDFVEEVSQDSDGVHVTMTDGYELTTEPEGDSIHIASLFPKSMENRVTRSQSGGSSIGLQYLKEAILRGPANGVKTLTTLAAGSGRFWGQNPSNYTGFKTWPKMGFDRLMGEAGITHLLGDARNRVSSLAIQLHPDSNSEAYLTYLKENSDKVENDIKRLAELAEVSPDTSGNPQYSVRTLNTTKEGRRLWANYGRDIPVTFDLTPGSESIKTFVALIEEMEARATRRTP